MKSKKCKCNPISLPEPHNLIIQIHLNSVLSSEANCKLLFTSAKITHLAKLPQGKVEARKRVKAMVEQMDKEGFGHCTNTEACEAECPMGISVLNIARMNWEYNTAQVTGV